MAFVEVSLTGQVALKLLGLDIAKLLLGDLVVFEVILVLGRIKEYVPIVQMLLEICDVLHQLRQACIVLRGRLVE